MIHPDGLNQTCSLVLTYSVGLAITNLQGNSVRSAGSVRFAAGTGRDI